METRDVIGVLLRRKWLIIITTIAAIAIATVGSFLIQPTYNATATIRVSGAPNPLIERADLTYVDRIMNTFTIIARSNPVLENVIDTLELDMSPRDLRSSIKALMIKDTELVQITASSDTPQMAAAIADAVAAALITHNNNLPVPDSASKTVLDQLAQVQIEIDSLRAEYDRLLREQSDQTTLITETGRQVAVKQQVYESLLAQYDQVRLSEALSRNAITIIESAEPPSVPSRPRKKLNVALGAVLGVMGGVGLSLLVETLDKKIYTPAQIRNLVNVPIIGTIPYNRHGDVTHPSFAQREAFRHLRTNVMALEKELSSLKTLMVASAGTNDGKSTLVAGLAVSIAQLGRSILIVDCDLRQPQQHKTFNLSNTVGLMSVLKKQITVREAIQITDIPEVFVLTSGPLGDNPTELLSSPSMADMLQELRDHFDMILLDTPPIIPVADAAVLAPMTDGVLQIVRCGHSSEEGVLSTFGQIGEVRGQTLGIVLNDVPKVSAAYYSKLEQVDAE